MSKGKKVIFGVVGTFVVLIALGAMLGEDRPEQANTSQNTNPVPSRDSERPGERTKEVKYKEDRLKALAIIQVYKTNHIISQGTKFEINAGTSLDQVFSKQKETHLIHDDSRWISLKDGSRYVVMYHGNFSGVEGGMSSNNPQWAVFPQGDLESFADAKIYALNGTAKGYTPELGEAKIKVNGNSKALTFYLRWESLMEADNWDEIQQQPNLDIVAKEFKVSSEEADALYQTGATERNAQGKAEMDSRGDVLSDEKIIQLLQEQGDF